MNRFLLILGLCFSISFGQNLQKKENSYLQLQAAKQVSEQKLDSLNQSLDKILSEIDWQKSRNKKGNRLSELMSTAFSITKEIENTENQVAEINKSILKLEKELNEIYAGKMTLLEEKLKADISPAEKEKLEQELSLLAEKRILVFPLFRHFSFDPAKVKEIDLKNTDNEFEKEILIDYLLSAHAQVDSNLNIIIKKEEELEENNRLKEKADIFMGDVTNSRIMGFYESSFATKASEASLEETLRNGPSDTDKNWDYAMQNSVSNTVNFLNELEYLGMPPDELVKRFKISPENSVTTDEYLEILKSSRDFLTLYKNMLGKKIAEN